MRLFKVGDRVRYVSGAHGEEWANPLWGGEQGNIAGTVDEAHGGQRYVGDIGVTWDNDAHNSYCADDLDLLGDMNPNSKIMI